jgi:hypothetical protein
MKVAILCEFSGTVRDAFIALGHDAISCDLLETESPGPHLQGDCRDYDWSDHDLVIAHPPCTYLAVSGLHWNKRIAGRSEKTEEALDFVRYLMDLPVGKIAIENPISCISSRIRRPEQIIQPWQFGHPESKKTCLWLKGLPKLKPENILELPESGRWINQTPSGQNNLGPSKDRWKIRSMTYQGIAKAMARQWGIGES